jgi:SAM-dependent methyltransferase
MQIKQQDDWLVSDLGQYLLHTEQALFDTAVSDVFGYHAVQLGMPQLQTLKNSRIPHIFNTGNRVGNVLCESAYLPIADNCIDLICLPHVLEFSENPHQTLREAERVLVPEGHLILSGFNPLSTWGLKKTLSNKLGYPWRGHFFTLSRIKDWLALLGLELVSVKMVAYEWPVDDQSLLRRLDVMNKVGAKCWPMLGGCYLIIAKKRVVNMTLLKPNWKKSAIKSAVAVGGNPKTKPTQQKSKQQ